MQSTTQGNSANRVCERVVRQPPSGLSSADDLYFWGDGGGGGGGGALALILAAGTTTAAAAVAAAATTIRRERERNLGGRRPLPRHRWPQVWLRGVARSLKRGKDVPPSFVYRLPNFRSEGKGGEARKCTFLHSKYIYFLAFSFPPFPGIVFPPRGFCPSLASMRSSAFSARWRLFRLPSSALCRTAFLLLRLRRRIGERERGKKDFGRPNVLFGTGKKPALSRSRFCRKNSAALML